MILAETIGPYRSADGKFTVTFDQHTAALVCAECSGWPVLPEPAVLRLSEAGTTLLTVPGNPLPMTVHGVKGGGTATVHAEWSLPEAEVEVALEYGMTTELEVRLSLRNLADMERTMDLTLALSTKVLGWRGFFPANEDHFTLESGRVYRGYYRPGGASCVIPLATVYSKDQDCGLTFFADPQSLPGAWEITFDASARLPLAASHLHLPLKAKATLTTSIYLAGHEGDWRPGLAAIRGRYPDDFEGVSVPAIAPGDSEPPTLIRCSADADWAMSRYRWLRGSAVANLVAQEERDFRKCTAAGLLPAFFSERETDELAPRYQPLFNLINDACWCLQPHALLLPPGQQGNIYERTDGDFVVVIVAEKRSTADEGFDLKLPVKVRLREAPEIRAVYVITPDLLGKRRAPFTRKGDVMEMTLPRQKSCTGLLLARGGLHFVTDAPEGAGAGTTVTVRFCADNWTEQLQHVRLEAEGAQPRELTIPPEGNSALPVKATIPQSGRLCLQAAALVGPVGRALPVEVYTDQPLVIEMEQPKSLALGRAQETEVRMLNLSAEPITAQLVATSSLVQITGLPAKARIEAGNLRTFTVVLCPRGVGDGTLTFSARAGEFAARRTVPVQVRPEALTSP